ncbi:SDR family oxidoreductase [Streptomyces sp. 1114.5]|uniref:SDR family oxidoreductase n=1 Tax=Streptomyces sp. 1114.5 TaxID=1938830 RepID=UPI000EAD7FC6|nr:SDR family oxidoreductase [Streptomyces sp. 1114.5]
MCGAIEALSRALAVELAPIRVNAVRAGMIRTPLWSGLPDTDREQLYAQTAAGRHGPDRYRYSPVDPSVSPKRVAATACRSRSRSST